MLTCKSCQSPVTPLKWRWLRLVPDTPLDRIVDGPTTYTYRCTGCGGQTRHPHPLPGDMGYHMEVAQC